MVNESPSVRDPAGQWIILALVAAVGWAGCEPQSANGDDAGAGGDTDAHGGADAHGGTDADEDAGADADADAGDAHPSDAAGDARDSDGLGADSDLDPCSSVDCGEHGRCVVEAGTASCECDSGFVEEASSCVRACEQPLPEDVEPDHEAGAPFGYLDEPSLDAIGHGSVRFAGWVLGAAPLDAIQLWIDDELRRELPLDVERPDVCAAFPSFPCGLVGFSVDEDLSDLTRCDHIIEIRAQAAEMAATIVDRARLRLTDEPPPCSPMHGVAVATTSDPGFFSLRAFGGELYAGTYGTGKIYSSSNGWAAPVTDLNVGESVYVMRELDGYLYANTENRGEIWRSPDGATWERVFDGESTAIGTGLEIYGANLYAAYTTLSNNAGRVYRSSTGNPGTWSHVFGDGSQGTDVTLRDLAELDGVLYLLSYDWGGSQGGLYATEDGATWTWTALLPNMRPIKAHVWNGYLWISTSPYLDGRVPPAGVYRWDGSMLENVYEDPGRAVGTDIIDHDGALYFVDDANWRALTGTSGLHCSETGEPGDWAEIHAFDESEAMDMEVFDGSLFVATRQEGGHGAVYRMEH